MTSGDDSLVRGDYRRLLRRTMYFLAGLVILRFVLEIAGARAEVTRYLSVNAGLCLAAIYVAAVAPLHGGLRKFYQLPLAALVLSAWTVGWIILATILAGGLRLERSHFAVPEDFGNLRHLGVHVLEHLVEIGVFFVVLLVLMALVHLLWRWPVTVGPGALLGAIVIIRYYVEALGAEPWRAAAWSSTVGVLLCAFYLGGVGPRLGLLHARQLLAPALVLGWVWRIWVFIAALFGALLPFYKTHFFDPSAGRVGARLAQLVVVTVVEGFIAGLIVWGIAVWISRATRPREARQA
jgi:hypothetical protein